MHFSRILAVGLLASAFATGFAAEAGATVATYSSQSAWTAAVTQSTETVTEPGTDFTNVSSITGLTSGSSLTGITPQVDRRTVGSSWSTWVNQPASNGTTIWDTTANNVALTFNPGTIGGKTVNAFGFYAEPDTFNIFNITLNLSDGSTLSESVNGSSGASFFGWVGTGITGFNITTTDSDFAFGDFFEGVNTVPEPLTLSLFGAGLAGAAMLRRRKSK